MQTQLKAIISDFAFFQLSAYFRLRSLIYQKTTNKKFNKNYEFLKAVGQDTSSKQPCN